MAKFDEANLLRLVDGIYEASLDRSRWRMVLDNLSNLYVGKAVLFQQDLIHGESSMFEFCGFEPSFVQSYTERYAALNPCLESRARLPAGAVATDDMLIERAVAEQSEFYNDWLRPQGLRGAVGAVLEKGTKISVNLAILRSARREPVSRVELGFFEQVAPHLRRALRLDRELSVARIGRDLALDALDRLGSAALVVDGDGRVLYASPRAEDVLCAPSAASGLGTHNGRLCGSTPRTTQLLISAVRACVLNGVGLSRALPPAALRLDRADAAPLSVLVFPLCTSKPFGLGAPGALLLVRAPEDMPSFDAVQLARFYGLTPACGRLFAGLLGGQSLAEYAKVNRLSLNTVKTQLKRIFLETGEERQSDLIRLVLSDPIVVAAARVNCRRKKGVPSCRGP